MTPNNLVHENERLDELHRNGYYIIQDPARFCFGMDAVLLSGFARARRGERVLDLGTGTGIIPILMEAKTEAEDFTALEIQEESADMARRSVLYNHLEEKIRVVTGDIKDASGIFGASSFDIVTTNPPYMIGQHGISSGSEAFFTTSSSFSHSSVWANASASIILPDLSGPFMMYACDTLSIVTAFCRCSMICSCPKIALNPAIASLVLC